MFLIPVAEIQKTRESTVARWQIVRRLSRRMVFLQIVGIEHVY